VDNIWATRKEESLTGIKFMVVELLYQGSVDRILVVAADLIGAGIGERVLLSQGSSARRMKNLENTPVDMSIVGIIDADCNSIGQF
jgi:ethanolamine utilization protein EutN